MVMKNTSHQFHSHAQAAVHNRDLQDALAKLGDGFQAKRAAAIASYNAASQDSFEQLKVRGQSIKRRVMSELDEWLMRYESAAIEAGAQVHWAENGAEACQAILDICKNVNAKTVTKGKSMVSEEIGLNAFLVEHGIRPVETDLGEYILQVRNEAPSHIVVPAVHLSKRQVEESFRETHQHLSNERDLTAPESLVAEARNILRKDFIQADVGITGANYLVAETGSSVIVTNEGNGDLTQTLPKVHIVITTIERVIPTLEDLSVFLKLLPRSATGQNATAYVTVSTGPKKDEDLSGPEEYHVVLLDNGRSDLLGTENQDVLNCIRCGACMNHCPVYETVGGHSYGWVYPGPIGAAVTPAILGVKHTQTLPNASTFCGRCVEVCPVKIPLTDIMRRWREQAYTEKLAQPLARILLKLWVALALHPRAYRLVTSTTAKLLYWLGGRRRAITWLPFAKGWTQYRDLPAPSSTTFFDALRKQNDEGVVAKGSRVVGKGSKL